MWVDLRDLNPARTKKIKDHENSKNEQVRNKFSDKIQKSYDINKN